jgi:hypothetical protein
MESVSILAFSKKKTASSLFTAKLEGTYSSDLSTLLCAFPRWKIVAGSQLCEIFPATFNGRLRGHAVDERQNF